MTQRKSVGDCIQPWKKGKAASLKNAQGGGANSEVEERDTYH